MSERGFTDASTANSSAVALAPVEAVSGGTRRVHVVPKVSRRAPHVERATLQKVVPSSALGRTKPSGS